MDITLSSQFVLCLFMAFCLIHLSSTAALGQVNKANIVEKGRIASQSTGRGQTRLFDIIGRRQLKDEDGQSGGHRSLVKRSIVTRRSGNNWADLDEDIEQFDEEIEEESAEDYIKDLIASHKRNSELDTAIENYVASFCSDLLELIHVEMKAPRVSGRSSVGHKQKRRKTRPKRSLGSSLFLKNDGSS